MRKKVLLVTSSLREGSNSDQLAEAFAAGARDAGHVVDIVSLKGKQIAFCQGCLACQKTKRCIIKDDAGWIAEKICAADVVVFASPVYYYGLSGQLKTLLDRCNPLYFREYTFRAVYLLATAAENAPSTVEGSVRGLQGWVDCFDNATFAGTIFAGGVAAQQEIKQHPALEQAYEAGKSIA